jgi:autotransporter-associated beta strand protein
MKGFLLRFPIVAVLAAAVPLAAQTFTWSGGGGDDLFGTGANWGGSPPSVGGGVVLQFDGATRPMPDNNYSNSDDFGEWRLLATAGADFTVIGNGFGLHSKIENDAGSGRLFTVNTAGIYARNNMEINPVGGNIAVGALVALDNNATLNVYDGGFGNTLVLNGILSSGNANGGNGSLILNQTATVVLAADGNNYGATTLNSGTTLRVGGGGSTGSLGTGAVTNNGSLVFDRSGLLTAANDITGSGSVAVQAGTVAFSTRKSYTGNTVVNGGILDLTGGGGQDGTIRGSVTVDNGATLRLSTSDATGWGTGVQRITAINVNEASTLNVNTTSNQTFSNLALTLQGGTISGVSGSNFDFFNGSTSLTTLASATQATVSMNARLRQTTTTFNIADGTAAVDLLWSGQLNQEGTGRNFTKDGAGRMDLTGAATYSGASTINGGHLLVSNEWRNTASITVNNGATLELGTTNMFVGGHGTAVANSRVITANASTLLMNGSMDSRIGNVTLNNGSTWTSNRGFSGWDVLLANTTTGAATVAVTGSGAATMNGSGGMHLQGIQNFNVADTTGNADADLLVTMRLDNPGNSGGAAGGIRKQGAGTMLLNNLSNSFAGDLVIEAGAIVTGTAQGGGTTGHLGAVNGTRVITVGTGAILDFRANNQFGGGGKSAATIPQIVINGGTLTANRFNIVGNLSLNGGTLAQSTADSGGYEGYQFLGTVTVGGSAASVISSGNGRANHLVNGTTSFDVADATSDANPDLLVTAPLRNASNDYFAGAGSLLKTGAGTMVLGAANSYTGSTTVAAGVLALGATGSIASSAAIAVAAGATLDVSAVAGGWSLAGSQTLSGTGVVAGAATLAGTVAPGASIGNLTFSGDLAFAAASTYAAEINTTSGTADRVSAGGDLTILAGSVLDLADLGGNDPLAQGTKLALIDYTGGFWNGGFFTFNAAPLANLDSFTAFGNTWEVRYDDSTDGQVAGDFVTLTVIPEPTAAVLLGLAAAAAVARRRRA